MNVLIVEDEQLAQEYLINLLGDSGIDLTIIGSCNSLKSAIQWFLNNEEPDLVFMDIDLGDGLCFEIFDVVDLNCPIIFTTAYDEYAIQAFKVNSIDYLLKPISFTDLLRALSKFSSLTAKRHQKPQVAEVAKVFSEKYKSRFIIKVGQHIKSLPSEEIMYFSSRDKATYVTGKDHRSYLIEYSLDRLESIMDPVQFFRINRKYIIHFKSIKDIISYSGSRLKVFLIENQEEDIVVSRDRVNDFKRWLDR